MLYAINNIHALLIIILYIQTIGSSARNDVESIVIEVALWNVMSLMGHFNHKHNIQSTPT